VTHPVTCPIFLKQVTGPRQKQGPASGPAFGHLVGGHWKR